MEPLLSIQLFGHLPAYRGGDLLRCDYQIDAVDEGDVQAVEASVLWYTEGKGDEDMGIHFFERRVAADVQGDLRELYSFQTPLPYAPLSYEGELIQIRWCVRLRVFLKGGREAILEHPFRLANRAVSAGTEAPKREQSAALPSRLDAVPGGEAEDGR